MKEIERDCILCIDEMEISAENCFDPNKKKFYGHVTLGNTEKLENHITVILLRGLNTKWKQIISCDVTSSSTKGNDTMIRIQEVLKAAQDLNLKVRAVVSDMGANNKSMWQSMGIEVNHRITYFFNKNEKVQVLANAQHLLKNLRSALLNGSIIVDEDTMTAEDLPTQIITGAVITDLWKYNMDNSSGLGYLHRLQKTDLYPDHYSKMKVGGASGWKPLNTGLIISSLSFMNLVKELFHENYKFVLGSRLTQDALENVFSQIRKRAGRKPNALKCKRIMKILIVLQSISDINQTNYCNDSDTHLLDVSGYLDKSINNSTNSNNYNDIDCINSSSSPISISEQNILYYITGSIQNRLLKKGGLCEICLKLLSDNSDRKSAL